MGKNQASAFYYQNLIFNAKKTYCTSYRHQKTHSQTKGVKKVYAAENCPTHPSLPQKITVRPVAPVIVL